MSNVINPAIVASVELRGFSHLFPDDVDILVEGPMNSSQNLILMSDAGGGSAVTNLNITFTDSASSGIPDGGPLVSGSFKPANYSGGTDAFPTPAPSDSGNTTVSALNGNVNGTFKLYVIDEFTPDDGSITDWCLNILPVGCSDASECDDGNFCTADTCDAGTCNNTPSTAVCDDFNPCTEESCTQENGCGYAPAICDDGIACTTDSCIDFVGCQFTPDLPCDDFNSCTVDYCDFDGCHYDPAPCEDAALCKDTSNICSSFREPFSYLLALPHTSSITNETELFESIPGATFVTKFNAADDSFQRWDGSRCCKLLGSFPDGFRTDCHTAGPGECFTAHPEAGEGFGVGVSGPGRYTIHGTDGSSTITLKQPEPGISRSGNNLISIPYCSPVATAKDLMDSIGFAKVVQVQKFLSASNTFVTYTGRSPQSPSGNFPLVPGEAYFVKMKTTVTAYVSQYSPSCPVSGCSGCGPDGAGCNDGNGCTGNDHCSSGACIGDSIPAICDDGIPETADACHGCLGGSCSNTVEACARPVVNGTIELPPEDCGYVSSEQLHNLVNGLPPGTEVHISVIHGNFNFITRTAARAPTAIASTEIFDSDLVMHVTGTGILAGVNCDLRMTPVHVVVESQPTQPGQANQGFDTNMRSITGTLSSDSTCNIFQSLAVTAGTDHGLPSPGHVELRQQGDYFNVASFFSVNVRMDFVGKGVLEGMSGSTTQVVMMATPTTIPAGGLIDGVVPTSMTRAPGTSHSITVVLSDITGAPVTGRLVAFSVLSGPNAGASGTCSSNPSCTTDANGRVSFTYTSNGALGTDQIRFCPTGGSCSTASVEWACTPEVLPDEVAGLVLSKSGNQIAVLNWSPEFESASYDVLRGQLSSLPVGPGGGDETCLVTGNPTTQTTDSQSIPPGSGRWYLVSGRNSCGHGTYGSQVQGGVPSPRTTTTCP